MRGRGPSSGENAVSGPRIEALKGHAAMLLFALCISGSFSLGKRAAPHLDPAALNALRFLLGALILTPLALPRLRRRHLAAPWLDTCSRAGHRRHRLWWGWKTLTRNRRGGFVRAGRTKSGAGGVEEVQAVFGKFELNPLVGREIP